MICRKLMTGIIVIVVSFGIAKAMYKSSRTGGQEIQKSEQEINEKRDFQLKLLGIWIKLLQVSGPDGFIQYCEDMKDQLSEKVANPNDVNLPDKMTPLMFACRYDTSGKVAQYLLKRGNAKVNHTDELGRTALDIALNEKRKPCIETLKSQHDIVINEEQQSQIELLFDK